MRELSFSAKGEESFLNSCIREYDLVQYTPHIHFQSREEGACLRASEVKPKLDRFICEYMKKKENIIPAQWILKEDKQRKYYPALNYKMFISGKGQSDKPGLPKFSSYFGNMGEEEKKGLVIYKDGLKLKISVPSDSKTDDGSMSLIDTIDECLPAFFAFTCFGTRSTKGWGSYGIENPKNELTDEYLLKFVDTYYKVKIANKDDYYFKALKQIKVMSNMMKAGINYKEDSKGYYKGRIFVYFLNGIKSEKKFIKQCLFPPTEPEEPGEYRYVRAMLGLTEKVHFQDEERKGDIKIKDKGKIINRFNNPIHFIPNKDEIIILPTDIPKVLGEREFIFRNQSGQFEKIKTPKIANENPDSQKGEFQLVAFMDWFMEQFNNEVDFNPAPQEVNDLKGIKIRKVCLK